RILRAGTESGFSDPVSTSCTVISGDSGGPLFNLRGEVIGINSNINLPWFANNHVPVSVLRKSWDQFIAGETLSSGGANGQSPDFFEQHDYLEDPFAEVREKFLELLPLHAARDGLEALVERPRLLSLHRMQAHLERWEPEEEAAEEPKLGFALNSSTGPAVIAEIEPDSPAAGAGLQSGDQLLTFNGKSAATAPAFALALRSLDPAALPDSLDVTAQRGGETLSFSIAPSSRPARRHFLPPVTDVLTAMSARGMSTAVSRDVQELESEFIKPLVELEKRARYSVLELHKEDGNSKLGFATIVSADGEMLTQASLLPEDAELVAVYQDESLPIEVVAKDELSDLALLRFAKAAPEPLAAVEWSEATPTPGTLVYSPTGDDMTMECAAITRPHGTIVPGGKEARYRFGSTPPYLGVQLEEDAPLATVVMPDSPADRAGILEGDRITKANGQEISSPRNLLDIIKSSVPGDKLRLTLKRDGKEFKVSPILDQPPTKGSGFSPEAARIDKQLMGLSAGGGKLSTRRSPFPECYYHHLPIIASETGSAIFDASGLAYGINICRSLRHRTLALTVPSVQAALTRLRAEPSEPKDE
ncbi:PDZ domain-containing protein, partial [Haloferula sp.]|uniref:PDZ domain-containing protein n=1 Tax=Haloferula sp. TaxID=2497595 RepID=UPI003C755143